MSTIEAPRRSFAAPSLSAEAVAALPWRKPAGLCLLVGFVLGAGMVVPAFYVYSWSGSWTPTPWDNILQSLVLLAPWLLTFPWLRHLDLRRVPWFFGCLILPFGASVLLTVFTYRALKAPYRNWAAGWWNAHRARTIPGQHPWVLVSEVEAGPEPMSARAAWWTRLERICWVLVIVATVPIMAWEDRVPVPLRLVWGGSLVTLALTPNVIDWVLRIRSRIRRSRKTSSPL